MTLVSNDPSWWLSINAYSISSYYIGSWTSQPHDVCDDLISLAVMLQLPHMSCYCTIGVSKTKCERITDILTVFLALTFGQEAGPFINKAIILLRMLL